MAAMRQSWTDDRLDDLRMEMRAGFARTEQLIEQHAKQVEQRFELLEKSIDQRFDLVDRRFQSIEGQLSSLDQRLQRVEGKFDPLVYSIVGLAAAMFIAMAGLFAAIVF